MNKLCPVCNKVVSRKHPHVFIEGKRVHKGDCENEYVRRQR
jgi:hypothetical protein